MEITKNTSKHSISSNFNYPKIYSDIKEVPEESKGYSKSKVHDAYANPGEWKPVSHEVLKSRLPPKHAWQKSL